MKISIIGSNSYIARNFTHYLQNNRANELFLYDYQSESVDQLENYAQINVLDLESVKKINFDVDLIYVFVGKTGTNDGFNNYSAFIDINEKSLLNILTIYVGKKSNSKIVFPSTRLVYKGSYNLLSEDSEKEFKTVYAINKYSCENYLNIYHNLYGIKYCVLRICVPYGTLVPGATSYGTAEFMLKKAYNGEDIILFGDGSLRRTITYIGDLCSILYYSGIDERVINDIYNVGGENFSLFEMACIISKKFNVGVSFVEWSEEAKLIESGDTVFNSNKLDSIIGDKHSSSFENWCNNLYENIDN